MKIRVDSKEFEIPDDIHGILGWRRWKIDVYGNLLSIISP